jgi:WD40 repeat protein
LDFSPDGQYLVIGGDGCKAVLLHVIPHPYIRALQDLKMLQQVERVDRVYTRQFSPNSKQIAIGGFDGKVAFSSVSLLLSDESHSLVEIS